MPGNLNSEQFAAQAQDEQEFDLLRWIQLLWDHRWWIVGVTGASVILAGLYSFLATPQYSATATVYVQSYSRSPVSGYNPTGATSWMEEEKFYNSQPEIIMSQAVMEEAADKVKLGSLPSYADMKDPWKALRGMTKVDTVRDSALFKITVTAPEKDKVAQWANAVAEVYKDRTLKDALGYIAQANEVMLEEARKMQEEYVRQQSLVATTLQAEGSYFPQNQKEILDKRIEALELKANDVAVRESEVSALVSQIRNLGAGGDEPASLPATSPDQSMQDLTRQYNEMVRDLSKLQVKFTAQHPDVKALRARISRQRQVILGSYENQLAALRGERANLQAELENVKRQGLQFVEGASKGEALTTSGTAIKKYMDLLYDKMKEMNITSALLSSNVRVVNPALPPLAPVRPRKAMNILLGLMLGGMLGVGSIVALAYLDTTIKSVDDVEGRLGMNLLTMVPKMEKGTERASVEAFQTLRTALIFASDSQQKNVILVTSSAPKEGKTTVTVNLAKALATTGDRVILLDCDLRRPSVSRYLGHSTAKKGLSNYLAERGSQVSDYIVPGPHPNMSILPSGPVPPNPPELFSMKRFKELLAELKGQYTWVLLDSPPFLTITDAQILAPMADLVVLVGRFKKTHRPMMERVALMLRRNGAPVAGFVLNDIETRSSQYYDYYYYSHYYYETGQEPKRLPWILGRTGAWSGVFGRKSPPRKRSGGA
jgi:capsular exopolysaccharide synthesis family protein